MNLIPSNLKPRTKQCAIDVKLRDGVVSRLVQEKHEFIRNLSTVQFVVSLTTDQVSLPRANLWG